MEEKEVESSNSSIQVKNDFQMEFDSSWESLLENKAFLKLFLRDILEKYIKDQRWYAGKSSTLKYIELSHDFKIEQNAELYYGLILEINFKEAFFQHYFIPLAFVTDEEFAREDVLMNITLNGVKGYLVDAVHIEAFRKLVFERIIQSDNSPNIGVQYHKGNSFKDTEYVSSRLMGKEQSNTSIIINDHCVIKFFRRLFSDRNPDYEISRFLSDKANFSNVPRYQGSINVLEETGNTVTIALMQEMVPNEGEAWSVMVDDLDKIFQNLELKQIDLKKVPDTPFLLRLGIQDVPPEIIDIAGLRVFLQLQQLARRTAEMHSALGSEFEETAFEPQRFNADYDVWLKNKLIYQFQDRLNMVENNLHKLEGLSLELAEKFLENKGEIRRRFMSFNWTKLKGERLRVHGDYHLGQILVHKDDYFILDFEGEPESTIRDRKVKQPPLKDVAGLFRSFHYAIYSNILTNKDNYPYTQDELFGVGEKLYRFFCGVFLMTYTNYIQKANINIGYDQERVFLLKYLLLEKAVYELGYEMNARPDWALIPLQGIDSLMKEQL